MKIEDISDVRFTNPLQVNWVGHLMRLRMQGMFIPYDVSALKFFCGPEALTMKHSEFMEQVATVWLIQWLQFTPQAAQH